MGAQPSVRRVRAQLTSGGVRKEEASDRQTVLAWSMHASSRAACGRAVHVGLVVGEEDSAGGRVSGREGAYGRARAAGPSERRRTNRMVGGAGGVAWCGRECGDASAAARGNHVSRHVVSARFSLVYLSECNS